MGLAMRRSCALLLALAGAAAGGQEPAPDPPEQARVAFRVVTFSELLGVAPAPGIGFPVEIPAHLRERRASSSTTGALLWAEPADWGLIRHGRAASGRNGMIVVQRSGSLRYDAARDQFADGTGLDERNLPERLGRQGARGVVVRRLGGTEPPMLLLEAELKGGEHLRVLYVQLGARARSVSYIGHTPWDARDDLAWSRLRDGAAAPR